MEKITPFDLNQVVRSWRENLAQSPTFRNENLAELETHLRDSIATLQAQGLSGEESFLIASRRLGNPGSLGQEFAKVNSGEVWRDRAFWMLAGMLFWIIGWDLSRATSSVILYFGSMTGVSGVSLGWIGVVAGFVALGFFSGFFWLMVTNRMSHWNKVATWLRSHPVGCAAVLLGTMLTMKILDGVFTMLLYRNLEPKVIGQSYPIAALFNSFGPMTVVAAIIVLFARLLSGRSKNPKGIRMAVWILVLFVMTSLLPSRTFAQVKPDSGMSSAKAVTEKKDSATLDDAMKLWTGGKKNEAVAKFLAVDFSKRPLFPSGSVLNYTEAQFMALPQAARDKLSKPMLDDIRVIKEIAAHVKKSAQPGGDKAKVDDSNAKLQQCGEAFDQPDSLALLKLVGKAFKKLAAADAAKHN